MAVATNTTRQKLADGALALGIGLRQARTVDIAPVMKTIGFDWLFIDMEHGSFGLDVATQISVAAQGVGITPIVRVPGFEHYHATRALDGGAHGVVIPHVDDAETAARMVQNCRYPPLGHRSVTGALPQLEFVPTAIDKTIETINALTFVVVMIETQAGVDNIEAIASTPGVDCLLIGTSDLCAEFGIPGQTDSPRVVEVYQRVIEACRKNSIYPGMGGVYELPLMEKYIGMGMQFILCGSDLSLMLAAGSERTRALRAMSATT